MHAKVGGFMWGIWSLYGVLISTVVGIHTKKQNTQHSQTDTVRNKLAFR